MHMDVLTLEHSLLRIRRICPNRSAAPLAVVAAVPVIVAGRTLLRRSPLWQRRAAYASSFLTRPWLRSGIDHHRRTTSTNGSTRHPDTEREGIGLSVTEPGHGLADLRRAQTRAIATDAWLRSIVKVEEFNQEL
jgi:hypothetical protein